MGVQDLLQDAFESTAEGRMRRVYPVFDHLGGEKMKNVWKHIGYSMFYTLFYHVLSLSSLDKLGLMDHWES